VLLVKKNFIRVLVINKLRNKLNKDIFNIIIFLKNIRVFKNKKRTYSDGITRCGTVHNIGFVIVIGIWFLDDKDE
jgi:hypothetical protein